MSGIFLINACCGRVQATVGSARSGLIALGCVRKQAEKDHGEEARNQPSIMASASVSALTSFSDRSLGSKINPFLPEMLLVVAFYYNNGNRSVTFCKHDDWSSIPGTYI